MRRRLTALAWVAPALLSGGSNRQRPQRTASAAGSGSSQIEQRPSAGRGSVSQHVSQTPPRRKRVTRLAPQARQPEGKRKKAAARKIRFRFSSANCAGRPYSSESGF